MTCTMSSLLTAICCSGRSSPTSTRVSHRAKIKCLGCSTMPTLSGMASSPCPSSSTTTLRACVRSGLVLHRVWSYLTWHCVWSRGCVGHFVLSYMALCLVTFVRRPFRSGIYTGEAPTCSLSHQLLVQPWQPRPRVKVPCGSPGDHRAGIPCTCLLQVLCS